METALEQYEYQMTRIRELTDGHPSVQKLLGDIEPRVLHRFLIQYCSLGVQVTAPVEGWIRRAGVRCRELGLSKVGDRLVKHSVHEAGHDRLFVDDTRSLVWEYNARYEDALDAEVLLARPCTPAMKRYIELHEETIVGPRPFAQVAIELEIEGLSVTLGPRLLGQIERVLGGQLLGCLTFLREHVAVDVGHTALNKKMLGHLLELRPDAIDALITAGSRALGIYMDFLGDCLANAEREGAAWARERVPPIAVARDVFA